MAQVLIGLSFVELVVSYMKTQCLPYFTGSHQLPKKCSGFSTYYECTMSEEQWKPSEPMIVFMQYISRK